jgi:hypothetical protein
MGKIKAIVKRPDEEYGHITYVSNTLQNLQNTVGGYIETIPLQCGCIAIVNEEGKIRGLEPNLRIPGDVLVGDIIICGVSGEEFSDVPIDFKAWKQYVDVTKG